MFNLSEPQKAVYYMAVASENSTTNVAGDIFFDFDVTVDAARETAAAFLNTCSIMHTRIFLCEGTPMQKTEEKHTAPIDIEVKEFIDNSEYDKWARADALKPIDIYGCLYRLYVIRIDNKVGFYCATHHIINDATSFNIMASFACEFLKKKKKKEIYPYTEYINSEETYKQSKRYKKDKEFWISTYNSCADELFAENHVKPGRSARKSIEINAELSEKIKQYCLDTENSEYSVFMAVSAVRYHRIYQKDCFFIGSPMLNRSNAKEENTFGLFVNTVPISFSVYDKDCFSDLCTRTYDYIMSAFRHQKYHYTQLLKDIGEENKVSDNLFDVVVSFINAKTAEGSHIGWFGTENQTESLQIHIEDRENTGSFRIHYDYQTAKYSEKDIERIHTQLCNLFADAVENPDKKIGELEILSAEERQKVLYDFNDTVAEYPKSKCIHNILEELSEKNPEKTAVVACDRTLTYKELNEEANAIAHSLIEKGIGRGDIVAFMLPRRSCLISAITGILKSGAAYLPVAPDYPRDRIEHILSDSSAKFCITDNNISGLLSNRRSDNPEAVVTSTDNCYCIYTSGSAGKPKGVLIRHNNMVNFCNDSSVNNLQHYISCECTAVLACGSIVFDISNFEIFLSLLLEKSVILANEQEISDAGLLADLIQNNHIDCIHCTPTKLRAYLRNKKFCNAFRNIRCVMVGGELFTEDIYKTIRLFSDAVVFNGYGPTETTMGVSFGEIKNNIITIGKPIANTQIYIVDKYMMPVPIGITGEICIAGDGVGAGYLNRPELTAERFIDNPFGNGRMYRTGDLGYWREDGNIIFVGRNDFQVKIRGLRIELGEIENAISNIEGINQSVAVVRKDSQDRQLICAFYTGEKKASKELRAETGKSLPKYMIPHVFTHLEEMPVTPGGKTDRNGLPEIDLINISEETEFAAPATTEERTLAEAVCSVLRTDSVSMLDNFFNIGGDSIKAIYIVSELEEKGYELHVADIMQMDTLADIAKAMKPTADKTIYEQGEVNGFVPFSPVMRVYLNENKTISEDFVHRCIFSADCDEKTAKKALDAIVSHHDMLRGSFCDDGIEIHPSGDEEIYSFRTISIDDIEEAKEYLDSMSVESAKLVNAVFCSTQNANLISITVHHFLIDLVSWEILIKDLFTVINQLKNKETVCLSAKTASFRMWNEELQKYSETISEESKEYLNNISSALDNTESLCNDRENVNDAEYYSFALSKDISHRLINEANNTYGTKINEILLTAAGLAAAEIANGPVGIIVESHGRTGLNKPIAVDRTVGWFTSCYPVVIRNNSNAADELISTKETLRRLSGNSIDYLLLSQSFHKNAVITFNFYKNDIEKTGTENKLIAFKAVNSVFTNKISIDCIVTDDIVTINISVPECRHKKHICEELGTEIARQTEKLVDICTATDTVIKTCSDFSDDELTDTELDELKDLFDWTDDDEQQH